MPSSLNSISTISLGVPFRDQKPGTSGLRKSTKFFQTQHYLESFIEAILRTLPGIQGGVLIVGGDGRYGNCEAIEVILRMAAAHRVKKVITTLDGILSTPAASHLIRSYGAVGGIILSASHNPGGIDGDFGVKINGPNGGPANESLTNQIYQCSTNLKEYKIINVKNNISLHTIGINYILDMEVEVIDGVKDYIDLMQNIFDFEQISDYIKEDFLIAFDALNAVTGPYAQKLLEEILGARKGTVLNGIPQKDFGGLHPDPNLTYANKLAALLLSSDSLYSFGAACDGDGDRNMILGRKCFVNPSDSLAILSANYKSVPAYAKGLAGVARSMPTSSAVDLVAKAMDIPCYETPTGWKFFGNLLDAGKITICGEESFGTGSNHIREKDGLWAVLYWLQILSQKKISVAELMHEHWQIYGRNYYSRHDYENISSDVAISLYERVRSMLSSIKGENLGGRKIHLADDFMYNDPIDGSISSNQGVRIILEDGSRIILRLSGTGTQGSTLRIYLEQYVECNGNLNQDPQIALKDLIQGVENIAEITKRTGMHRPTVIT